MVGQTYSTPMVALVPSDPQNPGGFVISNRRAYDAWGLVRQGAAAAEPWQRYCANLGHVQDDESGLIYMRARYYEPWSGRFVSEDPKNHGWNWYAYANSNPVNFVDATGTVPAFIVSLFVILIEGIIAAATDIALQLASGKSLDSLNRGEVGVSFGLGLLGGLIGHFARAAFYLTKTPLHRAAWFEGKGSFGTYFMKMIGIGTGTSLGQGHFTAVFRGMLMGGMGHIAMDLYGAYLLAHLED